MKGYYANISYRRWRLVFWNLIIGIDIPDEAFIKFLNVGEGCAAVSIVLNLHIQYCYNVHMYNLKISHVLGQQFFYKVVI